MGTKYKDFNDFWEKHGRFMDRSKPVEELARAVFKVAREGMSYVDDSEDLPDGFVAISKKVIARG